jgi:hypothetical protein
MAGFIGRGYYKYSYYNGSHIQLLLDKESLAAFPVVLGPVSSLLLLSTIHSFSGTTDSLLRVNYVSFHDRTPCLTVPLLFRVSAATVIRCCGNNVYLAVV